MIVMAVSSPVGGVGGSSVARATAPPTRLSRMCDVVRMVDTEGVFAHDERQELVERRDRKECRRRDLHGQEGFTGTLLSSSIRGNAPNPL